MEVIFVFGALREEFTITKLVKVYFKIYLSNIHSDWNYIKMINDFAELYYQCNLFPVPNFHEKLFICSGDNFSLGIPLNFLLSQKVVDFFFVGIVEKFNLFLYF